jgi:hypothetical protein
VPQLFQDRSFGLLLVPLWIQSQDRRAMFASGNDETRILVKVE